MTESLLRAGQFGENAQEFLFACAFWTIAADEKLSPGERAWLDGQFGAKSGGENLAILSRLESDRFFALFDQLREALTPDERRSIFPRLIPWLRSCAESDKDDTAAEEQIMEDIRRRLDLDAELARLQPAAPPAATTPAVPVRILKGHVASVSGVWIDRTGQTVLSSSEDRTARVWDLASGDERLSLDEQAAGLTCVLGSADGRFFFTASRDGTIARWETASGRQIWERALKRHGGISDLAVSGDGGLILGASEVGLISVLDATDGGEIRSFGLRTHATQDLRFLPDNRRVLAAHDDHLLRVWEVASGKELLRLKGHHDGVLAVDIGPDGRQAASGGRDNSVRLWDLGDGRELTVLTGHTFSVGGVGFSPDGRRLVSASLDHTVRAWDLATGRATRRHEEFSGGFTRLAVHPNGRDVVAGNSNYGLYVLPDFLL